MHSVVSYSSITCMKVLLNSWSAGLGVLGVQNIWRKQDLYCVLGTGLWNLRASGGSWAGLWHKVEFLIQHWSRGRSNWRLWKDLIPCWVDTDSQAGRGNITIKGQCWCLELDTGGYRNPGEGHRQGCLLGWLKTRRASAFWTIWRVLMELAGKPRSGGVVVARPLTSSVA